MQKKKNVSYGPQVSLTSKETDFGSSLVRQTKERFLMFKVLMDMVESVALKQRKVPFRSFHAGYPCTHLTIHRLHFIYDTFYEQLFQMFQLQCMDM